MTFPRPLQRLSDFAGKLCAAENAENFGGRQLAVLAITWAACTLLLFCFRPGYGFPPFDVLDSWVYTGYQWNLRGHIAEFGAVYYGSRLTLILPGALLHSLLPPLAANICYKLVESALLAAACAAIAYRARGLPTALLAVVLSVFCPQVIYALQTDYMDMAVILYGTVTLACITVAQNSRHWPGWIFLAGCAFACMGITNLSSIAMPGLGLAAYHLLFLPWGIRRQFASLALYVLAAVLVIAAGGLINAGLGGQFQFLKPQLGMITYFQNSPQNPWSKANWDWLKDATWLVVPAGALLWGLVRSAGDPAGDRTRLLIRALTGGLAVSLAVALNLEMRGIGVLAYSFYASFQLCLALPLLAACGAVSGRTGGLSPRWLLGSIVLLGAVSFLVDPLVVTTFLKRMVPLLPSAASLPVLAAIGLLLGAGLMAGLTARGRRPELLVLGIISCSIPLGFHGAAVSDRLPERYASVHAAFETLARKFSPGSYRFWLHPDQPIGLPLASTMLYGYRLFTLQPFPGFEAHNVSTHTIVIPCLPGQGGATLAQAKQVLEELKIDIVRPEMIPIVGRQGIGMDLACFSMAQRDVETERMIDEAKQGQIMMDLQFSANPPYTSTIIQTTFRPEMAKTITSPNGYPLFTPTDPQDYLWTPFHPIPNPHPGEACQLTLVANMPADGQCVCVVQTESYHELHRFTLTKHGESAHLIAVPAGITTLRIYLTTESAVPTALPTSITIYAPR